MNEASSYDFTDQFWHLIEKNMGCIVPTYLQYILRIRGYDNAASIGTLTLDDVQKCLPQDADRKKYFHQYHNDSDTFEILPGHVKLLQKVVNYINSMTESHGSTFFDEKINRKPDSAKGKTKGVRIGESYVRGKSPFSSVS